ncbi:cutinase family protein [Nocardioides sp.]|uniref:cutinase family protein n=1 Tax=Nocardioides sp. TaxID=35761 RepID=UPI003784052A
MVAATLVLAAMPAVTLAPLATAAAPSAAVRFAGAVKGSGQAGVDRAPARVQRGGLDLDAPCANVTILGARGSGEPDTDGDGFGTRIRAVVTAIENDVHRYDARRINEAPLLLADYPALSVSDIRPRSLLDIFDNPYFKGLAAGVRSGLAYLRQRAKVCPYERFVLTGYSQGAMVMHRILYALRGSTDAALLSRIDAAMLLADGDRQRNGNTHLEGTPPAGQGGVGIAAFFRQHDRFPNKIRAKVYDLCHKGDLVCDFNINAADIAGMLSRPTRTLAIRTIKAKLAAGAKIHTGSKYIRGQSLTNEAEDVALDIRMAPYPKEGVTLTGAPGVTKSLQLRAAVDRNRGLQWRPAPGSDLPPGFTLTSGGLLSGTVAAAGSGVAQLQVRATGFYRDPSNWIPMSVAWNFTACATPAPALPQTLQPSPDGQFVSRRQTASTITVSLNRGSAVDDDEVQLVGIRVKDEGGNPVAGFVPVVTTAFTSTGGTNTSTVTLSPTDSFGGVQFTLNPPAKVTGLMKVTVTEQGHPNGLSGSTFFKSGPAATVWQSPTVSLLAGSTATVSGTLTLSDGTFLPSREVDLQFAPTGDAKLAPLANQPAGTVSVTDHSAVVRTGPTGTFNIAVQDPPNPGGEELDDLLTVTAPGLGADTTSTTSLNWCATLTP